MHQRSTAPRSRRWVGGILSLLLITGCFPNPTKAPTGSKPSGTLVAGKPVASSSGAPPSEAPAQQPSVPTLPIEVKAPIISHNGGNVIQGTVMAPAKIISHNGGNIIGNNGGNIISHNGGNVVSNGGGNIISHNGGNLKISQVPLANAVVRLKDAAGKPVKDDKGNELVTKTDENGGYKFPVDVKGRNLVVHAEVPGQTADLVALLPKEGVAAGTSVAVDMASTLTLSYILELYVKGDLATFEKLPKDLESKARVQTEEAIVKGAIALPETLEREELVATVSKVLDVDQVAKSTFEEIQRILVVVGILNEGDGLLATEIPVSTVDGALSDAVGNLYVFSRSRHAVWKLDTTGIAHTLVSQGNWGYPDVETNKIGDSSVSGMAFDTDGSILLSDTDFNRIVRISRDKKVSVIAGTGAAGFSGDGGPATDSTIRRPTGLVVYSDGTIVFCDSENNRVRSIGIDGTITTIAGNGQVLKGNQLTQSAAATFSTPQGLLLNTANELLIADTGNDKVKVITGGTVSAIQVDGVRKPTSVSSWNGSSYVLHSEGRELLKLGSINEDVDTKLVKTEESSIFYFSGSKLLVSTPAGFVFNDNGRLYQSNGLANAHHVFGALLYSSSNSNQLSLAFGMAILGDDVYISDTSLHKLFKYSSDGSFVHFAGSGLNDQFVNSSSSLKEVPLPFPAGISRTPNDEILVSSIGTYPVVRKVTVDGKVETIAGNGNINYSEFKSGIAINIALSGVYDALQLPDGRVVIAEPDNNRLLAMDSNGNLSQLFSGVDLKYPYGLCHDASGQLNYLEFRGNRVVSLEGNERKTRIEYSTFAPEIPVGTTIRALAFDGDNNVVVASKDKVLRISLNGKKTLLAGSGAPYLNGTTKDTGLFAIEKIGFSKSGDLYILETNQLKKVSMQAIASL